VSCVNKLYKRTLFQTEDIKFDEGKSHSEDLKLNLEILLCIESMLYVHEPLYNYYQRERMSLSRTFREDLYTYVVANKNELIHIAEELNFERYIDQIKNHFSRVTLNYLLEVVNSHLSKDKKKTIIRKIVYDEQFASDLRKYKVPSYFYQGLKIVCLFKNTTMIYLYIK